MKVENFWIPNIVENKKKSDKPQPAEMDFLWTFVQGE